MGARDGGVWLVGADDADAHFLKRWEPLGLYGCGRFYGALFGILLHIKEF